MPAWATKTAQETMQADVTAIKTDVAAIKTDVAALKQQATPIGAVKFHLARPASGGGYDLTWHDPNDTVIYGIAAAYWSHTLIVRKDPAAGESPSYPTSPTDGVVVVDSHIRNQYLNTPFNDANGTSDSRYRAFPYATNGGYNDSAENQFDAGAIWTFGYILDELDDNPATCITYIEDNADFAPIGMDWTLATPALDWGSWKSWCEEYFKPAMLTFGGEIDYYLNPDNLAEKADGTASDISNTSYQGNAMNIVKPIYCHIHRSGSTIEVRFSNARQTEDWFCWTHMKSDGTFAPFCAWPLFEGSNINSVLRSMATGAKPQNNTMQAQEQKSQEQVATATENPTEDKTEPTAPARMSWDEIMADPEYNKQMQATIRARLKNAGAAEETLSKMAPALEVLARKHGQDPANPDYDALAKAINDDDAYYEDKALEMGVTVETAKRLDQQNRDQARAQREEARNLEQQKIQQHFMKMEQQAEALKKVFPNFDLRKEMQNPAFARMTAPGQGLMSVEDAYRAVHRKEIEAAQSQVIAQRTAEKMSNAIQAGSRRPDENGTSGQSASVTTFDYSKASKAQRDALKQQIRAAAARGEKLYPGR